MSVYVRIWSYPTIGSTARGTKYVMSMEGLDLQVRA
jgi:hypothetical protein